jgi:hypothetical protein
VDPLRLFDAFVERCLEIIGAALGGVGQWLLSPGFGGAAAVLAAVIAYRVARRQADITLRAQRKEQWWKRAEWALNLTLSDKSENREVGLSTLDALSRSEWAAEHEGDVVAAATEWALDPAHEPGSGADPAGEREWMEGRRGDDELPDPRQ